MMKIIIKLTLIACFFFTASHTDAQDLSLFSLDSVWQQNNTNPAAFMPNKFHSSFPSLGLGVNSSLAFNDIFTQKDNGKYSINVDDVIDNLEDDNTFRFKSVFEANNYGFHVKKNIYFSFGHAIHQDIQIGFPKKMIELIANGNAEFLNEKINIGPSFDIHSYNEYYLGLQVRMKKLTLGARLKILSGSLSVRTSQSDLELLTNGNDIYQVTLESDYNVEVGAATPLTSFKNFELKVDPFDFSAKFNNFGIGVDLGATFDVTEKLKVSASVVDLGSVKYREGLVLKSQGTYTYEGLDVQNILTDSVSNNITLDSIINTFNFTETQSKISRPLNTRFYVGAQYKVAKLLNVGIMARFRKNINNELTTSVGLNADFHIKNYLRFGATYVLEDKNFTNLGVRAAFKIGHVQIFALTDNIFTAFNIKGAKHANVLLGINLLY